MTPEEVALVHAGGARTEDETMDRIEQLKTAAGAAGDSEQVAMCERALAGYADATADCLAVCRDAQWERIDLVAWARDAAAGAYLADYWDGERDSGSRCGLSDSAIARVNGALAKRGLTLAADDVGIRVVAVEVQS
jgi:hypothetical protein